MKRFLFFALVVVILAGTGRAQEKLTLDKSIQIALEQSPVILKAKADITAAEGMAGQAAAGFLPQLSLKGGIGKYYSKPTTMQMTTGGVPVVTKFGIDEQADTTSYSASLTQAVFTGGKLQSTLAMANKGLEAAKEELRKISEDVKFNVINSYYGVLKAKKFVKLSEESVNMAKSHLGHIKALFKVGMSTRADTLRGEVQVAQAEIGLTKAKQALEISKNNFNNTIGRDLDAAVELVELEYDSKEIPSYNYKDLLNVAYESRPDWRQYVIAKKVAQDEVGVAYSGLWPMVSLVGNYDIGSTDYPSYKVESETWTALLSGSWNIFDGSATWNKIKEAKAKAKAQEANEINVKRAVAIEVKDAEFTLKSAMENVENTRKASELAEENFKIADLRYESGVGTNLEVIDAQVALNQARIDHLDSQHELQVAKARLNKAIGMEMYK